MIRFVDMRAADVPGSRFAFWNTATDSFVHLTSYAWDTWAEFEVEYCEEHTASFSNNYPLERFKGLCPVWVFNAGEGKASWSYNKQPVPGHPEWYFQIGLGGPCWFVILKVDTYTHVHVDQHNGVSAHNAPPEIVRWLLDNHPALDSWRKPTEDEIKLSWATTGEEGATP